MLNLKPILTILLACSTTLHAQSEDASPVISAEDLLADSPNVVLIIADDLGPEILATSEGEALLTPNIRSLAERSVTWENFYVAPIGALTRASLFTGRYNIRTKVLDSSHGVSMLSGDEMTLPEALAGVGYKTGLFGTWGLGDHYPSRPSDQGFQTSLTHRGESLGYPSEIITAKPLDDSRVLLADDYEVLTQGNVNDVFFNSAKSFIKQAKKHQSAFFVTISTSNSSTTPDQTLSYVKNFDRNVGELAELLKAEELHQNTIVVFLSNNGPRSTHFSSTLKGAKGTLYEGSVRSPLFISWPDKIKQGRTVTSNLAAHIDIMPTLLDACGNGVEDAFGFDGRSLLSQLESSKATLPKRAVYQQWHRGQKVIKHHHFMVRKGDWKLLNPSSPLTEHFETKDYELYNLANDPSETTNLAADNNTQVEELLSDYSTWFRDVTETRLRDAAPSYILVDREEENPLVLTWHDRLAKDYGFEYPGFWKLDFEHDGRCDIRVEFPDGFSQDLTGWTGELIIGKTKHTLTVHEGEKHYVFPGVEFTKGRQHLRCKFTSPDGSNSVSAYQVRLQHR